MALPITNPSAWDLNSFICDGSFNPKPKTTGKLVLSLMAWILSKTSFLLIFDDPVTPLWEMKYINAGLFDMHDSISFNGVVGAISWINSISLSWNVL